jgi:hypothetical protein
LLSNRQQQQQRHAGPETNSPLLKPQAAVLYNVFLQGMHGMLANDSASAQQLEVAHSQMLWLDGLMTEQGSDFIAGDSE